MKNERVLNAYLIITTIISLPVVIFALLYLFLCICFPRIYFKEQSTSINYDIISAKQIVEQMENEVAKTKKLAKYDLVFGGIEMELNKLHRGEIKVTFVEAADGDSSEADASRGHKMSKVIYADLDTNKAIFYKFNDLGRESKLYTGIVDKDNWVIDSTDAVRIAEEFFATYEDFRYDTMSLRYEGDNNSWSIFLKDRKNDIRYDARVDATTGEVTGKIYTPFVTRNTK